MRKIKCFMDLLICEVSYNCEHKKYYYNKIYGKIIYPVAYNPLEKSSNCRYDFKSKAKYDLIRYGFDKKVLV